MAVKPAHRIVIVGAGFGGLEVARYLASTKVRITVIDRRNHHLFQPLLYQVATASLATSEIAWPTHLVTSDVTIQYAAAPESTLKLLLLALGAGAVVLLRSLIYLFQIFKGQDER